MTVRRIDSSSSSIFGAPTADSALESVGLGAWPGGSAGQSPIKPAMLPASPARQLPAASAIPARVVVAAEGRSEATGAGGHQQEVVSPSAAPKAQDKAADIFDKILR